MSFLARVIMVVIGTTFAFLLFALPTFAQTANSSLTPNTEANVPQDMHTATQSLFLNAIAFINCQLTGYDIGSANHICLGFNSKTGKIGYAPGDGGLVGFMTSAVALVYTPPDVHLSTYTHYLAGNFGIAKQAQAATNTGYDQLSPMIGIWTIFRNVVFLLFVIVFIVVGFAIMLRAKIDPRTVMTIENQIPKIIIALILVTFSYAIAGLVIDLMWVLTYVSINIFATMDPTGVGSHVDKIFNSIQSTPFTFLDNIAPRGILGILIQGGSTVSTIFTVYVKESLNSFPFNLIALVGGLMPCLFQSVGNIFGGSGGLIGIIGNTLGNGGATNSLSSFGQCAANFTTDGVSAIAGGLSMIIIAFALFFALLRMWFSLIKSYVLFLLYALLGPFFIMMGVLPGSKVNFENWFRHLLAYSFVFPFAISMMLLGKVIVDAYANSTTGATIGFIPPLIGVSQASAEAMGFIIGFGVILLLPQALTMIQDALSAPDMKYLPGIGQMLAQGTQASTTIFNKGWERLTRHEDSVRGLNMGPLRKFFMHKLFNGRFGKWAGEEQPKK